MRHGWAEKEDLSKLKQHHNLPRLSEAGVATSCQIMLNAMESGSKRVYISKRMSGQTKGRVDEHEELH
eukprot:8585563-Pyramimonas_sp.AAC.1